MTAPAASALFETMPGWTGVGEAIPRGVAREWSRWGRSPRWYLDHVPGARDRARAGELAFGTVDSFLLWRLTGGRVTTDLQRRLLGDVSHPETEYSGCLLVNLAAFADDDLESGSPALSALSTRRRQRKRPA